MPTLYRPNRTSARRLGALLGLATATLVPAWAQTPPDAGRLLEESRQPARPALPPATAPRVVDVPLRPTITLPEGVTVQAGSFRVTGASSFPNEFLTSLLQPWVGKRLDINGLNEAAGALTRHYQANGHLLTYAYIPAQRVADGVVEIAVLEGRLDGVQVVTAQDVRLRDEVVQAHTDRLVTPEGEARPVLQAEVERQMLLLNDLPGVTARAAFTPGSSTGGADLVVSVAEDEPLGLQAEFNNHGSPSTGKYRLGVGLQLRNLFGWGDHTQARVLASNQGGLVSGSISSSVAVGGDGYRIGFSLSRLTYQLAGDFRDLGAVGNANTLGVDATYPVLRTPESNIRLRVAAEHKRLRDEVQLVGSSNPKRNNTLEATLSGDHRDGWGGVSAGSVVAQLGSLRLLDQTRRADDAKGLITARRYAKLGLQLARQQSLGGPYSLYARGLGQVTGGNLDSSEKLGLGGASAVRAYAPGEASVDQGALLTLEARYAHEYLGGNVVWGLFVDHAEGRVDRRPQRLAGNEAKLTGTGLSVQWSGADVGLSASLAWRGSRLPTAEGGDAKPRLYLQLFVTP